MSATATIRIRPSRPWVNVQRPCRDHYDCAVIGGGFAGLATAARLQASGLSTIVIEAHRLPGGCAGYFRRNGFSFDVGATTLVDAGPEGVLGELVRVSGIGGLDAERLPAYSFTLPDRTLTLWHDKAKWREERLRAFGHHASHRRLWALLDELSTRFWPATRRGLKLPITSVGEAWRAARALGLRTLPLARHLGRTMEDALQCAGVGESHPDDVALRCFLSALVEDTVHSTLDRAPLINAALGISIRDAGVYRHAGGMGGFMDALVGAYVANGGELLAGTRVDAAWGRAGEFVLSTTRGRVHANQVVSAVPAEITARIAPGAVREALKPHLARNEKCRGGAVVVFLGVPEEEVADHPLTHHQFLHEPGRPLVDGNNMFVSVSAPGDLLSAPSGHRAVMISTHTDLGPWNRLGPAEYEDAKRWITGRLIERARRVYPRLGGCAVIAETGTPKSYEHFTGRPQGAVGGYRLHPGNANQNAIPQDIGVPGFWLAGDTTWPGLGTVACAVSSRIAAGLVADCAKTMAAPARAQGGTPGRVDWTPERESLPAADAAARAGTGLAVSRLLQARRRGSTVLAGEAAS